MTPHALDGRLIETVCARAAGNLRVRRTIEGGGRLYLDRQLPFLVVHRPGMEGDDGTSALVVSEAAYLVAPRGRQQRRGVRELVRALAETLSEVFGGFLIVEVWAGPLPEGPPDAGSTPPRFDVLTPAPPRRLANGELPSVDALCRALRTVRILDHTAEVAVVHRPRVHPPGFAPLLEPREAARLSCDVIGLQVRPVHRDAEGRRFPLVQRNLQRQVSRALRVSIFEFVRRETTHQPRHFHALGRRAFVKTVWQVDRALAEISGSFDLLLSVTPANTDAAFRAFQRHHYDRLPQFRYRPREVDPAALKRRLFDVPVERVEDPTLAYLFDEKRWELDRKITLVADRGNPRFLASAVALYGGVDRELGELASGLVHSLPTTSDGQGRRMVSATALATRAEDELARYREHHPGLASKVVFRDDTATLMVSRGDLLVGTAMRFPAHRVEALVQHEVGTHIVTHVNGQSQRFRLLASGLAGYEELQEGLAVLAEYLVGGLTTSRLRVLAGRVLACRTVAEGADFLETFRFLTDALGFGRRMAFLMSMRVHRGGGFVKDLVYLRGLRRVLDYLSAGGRIDTLFVGKIAVEHSAMIEELQRREVLVPSPLRPAYLDLPAAAPRLALTRTGLSVVDLARAAT